MKEDHLKLNSLLKFLTEGLEYGSNEENDSTKWPPFIKQLANEVQELDKKVQKAYEQDDPRAEELDVLFAVKQEELENALSELEDEPKIGGEEEEREASFGQEELMRQLASIYRHYVEQIPFQGQLLDKGDLLGFLRAWAKDYGWKFGGFKEATTDEQLLDAAQDSYERMKYLIRKK